MKKIWKNICKEYKENQKLREGISCARTLIITAVVMLILTQKIVILAKIPSGSMMDTIQIKDRLLGNRLAYENEDPQRGDIIIFRWPDDDKSLFIKRIIGLPGETVRIEDGKVYINDSTEPLEEDYLKNEPWVVKNGNYVYEVPEDSFFVLGDNRNNSEDSRYWVNTFVTRDAIVGKAEFIFFPPWNIKSLDE